MKKIFGMVLALAAFAFAVAPTVTSGVNYEALGIATGGKISAAAAYDTLGATDSSTLATGFVQDKFCESIFTIDAITGTGSDSLAVQVIVDALDYNGNLMFRTVVDTISTATGEAITLPLNGGSKYRIKLKSIAPSGTQIILNRMYILSRRVVTINRQWN